MLVDNPVYWPLRLYVGLCIQMSRLLIVIHGGNLRLLQRLEVSSILCLLLLWLLLRLLLLLWLLLQLWLLLLW